MLSGDIRNILTTVAGLSNPEHVNKTVCSLNFLVNDLSAEILARNIILLEIIHGMDPDKEDDVDYLWSVWYNVKLLPSHFDRLQMLITRYECDDNIDVGHASVVQLRCHIFYIILD